MRGPHAFENLGLTDDVGLLLTTGELEEPLRGRSRLRSGLVSVDNRDALWGAGAAVDESARRRRHWDNRTSDGVPRDG